MSRFYYLYQSNVIFPFWNWNMYCTVVRHNRIPENSFDFPNGKCRFRCEILRKETMAFIMEFIYRLTMDHTLHKSSVCMSRWVANDFSYNIIDMSSDQASLSRSVVYKCARCLLFIDMVGVRCAQWLYGSRMIWNFRLDENEKEYWRAIFLFLIFFFSNISFI